jgi:hypothetical protein
MKKLPHNKVVILDNEMCVYCGRKIALGGASEDHVIGRRFVPKGKLAAQWNLIVQACEECNRKKSGLEDDISAITMQANAWGVPADDDPAVALEAKRKGAGSFSRRTRKPVTQSDEEIKFKIPFAPGIECNFTFTAPPQIDSGRVYELASLQLRAIYYFLTYNRETKRGGYWPGHGFFPVLEAPRSDWGNPSHTAFMEAVIGWQPRFVGIGAKGFFKAIIRRHPEAECWAWGIEWNKNYRVVGFFGNQAVAQTVVDTFPPLEETQIVQGPDLRGVFRIETKLEKEHDSLFCWDDEA